jgi:23S rRNA (adenine2503-C2)-methyltransferase
LFPEEKMKKDIRDLSLEEILSLVDAMGEPRHRAKQIFKWLYGKQALSFAEMTDLPRTFVGKLEKEFTVGNMSREEAEFSKDGTQKFLWKLGDGSYVESVMIPAKNRKTICVSTQVGCKFRCPFCASGTLGFRRNLTPGEIVGQVVMVQRSLGERLTNVVFMGMGEPLDNFPNLARAIRTINGAEGMAVAARKITVSTCGLVPGIRKLKNLGVQVELSVSLHAAKDKLRDVLVPVNRKYPISELMAVLGEYFADTGRVITFEYALIKGLNDSIPDAEGVAGIAKKLKAKVNLIRCNAFGGRAYTPSGERTAELFKKKIEARGVKATIRRSRGSDIAAACGQLAAGHVGELRR